MSCESKKRLLACACFALAMAYPQFASAQAAIGDLAAPDATVKGSVQTVSTGTRVMSGSSVSAGNYTVAIRLLRGGELRVCPHSSVSLTASQTGRDLAVGMGTGGIETHYRLRSSADTIMTPDFRILLAGPGTFDYAISADARGNTCVRSLAGSGGAIIVSEIMGDGSYQVQPGEQVYFRGGNVNNPGKSVPPDCGCPTPMATMNANTAPAPSPIPVPSVSPTSASAPAPTPPPAQQANVPENSPEAVFAQHGHAIESSPADSQVPSNPMTTTVPTDKEIHVQVDAPFVFRGDAPENIPPAPQIAQLRLVYLPNLISETEDITVLPPDKAQRKSSKAKSAASDTKAASKSIFGHIKSFFGSIFK